ncbi:DNA polymerase epsilon subunit 2 [Schistosoma japonicum]|nr:DNA polymerase epsilon subunit 2 [Schistosoma japonicum]
MDVSKSEVDKLFKLNGLFLAPDASQYILSIVQRVEVSKRQKVLRKLVETILKQKVDNNKISKELCEAAVKECRAEHSTDITVLYVIDAFAVPYFRFSRPLKKFIPFVPADSSENRLIFPVSACAKAFLYAHRYEVIYQRMLRHQVFSQTTSLDGSHNTSHRLRQIEYLLASGSRIDSAVVLGLISQVHEGKWYAEDPSGVVELNLQQAIFHEGLLPEGSIALIEGFYDDKILYVTGIGLPPCESPEVSRRAFSVANPFGGGLPDAPAAPLDTKMHKLLTTTQAGSDAMLVILGETHLDKLDTLDQLNTLFAGYSACAPVAFILSGNFLSADSVGKTCPERRIILRKLLRQLLTIFKNNFPESSESQNTSQLNQSPQLILIPGPDDPVYAPQHILPRPGLGIDLISDDIKDRSPSSCPPWLRLASNPCRLRLYTREIVIFRANYSRLLVRHCIHLPTLNALDSCAETDEKIEDSTLRKDSEMTDMDSDGTTSSTVSTPQTKQQTSSRKNGKTTVEYLGQCLARCLASQAHLLPLLGHIAPVYWYHDQALSLNPLPNLVVAIEPDSLADLNASEVGLVTTGNCRFINPGRFGQVKYSNESGFKKLYNFKVYYPRTEIVEDSRLPST